MLKIGVETGYNIKFKSKDEYGAIFYMQDFFKKHKIELVRISTNKYNKQKKNFKEYGTFTKNGEAKTIKKPFTPDIIRNRKSNYTNYKYELLKDFKIFPSQKIFNLSGDKYETYMFLEKYQPITFLLSSFLKSENIQKKYGDKIVLKPIRSSGGQGIVLTTPAQLLQEKEKYKGLESLYIVQEFKKFSEGYPGIVKGNHDVRLMFAGKKIIETTLRIPKEGCFKSNIGSGGSQKNINIEDLPKELIKLGKKIYRTISPDQNEILSIDFAYCAEEKKRYMLEINASPGTWYYQTNKEILKDICKGLLAFFKENI